MNTNNSTSQWFKHPIISCLLLGLATMIMIASVQYTGAFQNLELSIFDQLLLQRPATKIDNRIVVIGETELDIRRYGHPLSDQIFTDTLQTLENAGVRVIGVDKYRDIPVAPGSENLKNVLQKYDNIVWIFFAGNLKQDFIPAPSALNNNPERLGFNDLVEDSDGVARRGLLMLGRGNKNYYAFPLLLSLHYLAGENIHAENDAKGNLSFNGISLLPIDKNFGAYRAIDAAGYQIMLDYPALPQSFNFFTLSDLLDNKIPNEKLHDKIVLLGGTAPSLQDYRLLPNETKRFGIEYHAYFVSQLLNTAINKKTPLRALPDYGEYFWLLFWCLIGALTGLRRRGLVQLFTLVFIELMLLLWLNVLLLNQGWWLPAIAPLIGLGSSIALSLLYFFSQERAERRQLMQLFSSHVSPEVAARLWDAREQFFSEGGIRPDTLMATVLFTDITNFTTVAEKMEPLILMKWLNQYMEEMSSIVVNHGGIVNKYMGDAIMAIFGAPVKHELESEITSDSQHAVECALRFNQRLQELNTQWKAQGLPTVTMRAGIYTGLLVAGSFGGTIRTEYTVIGDTVNIASRLESFDKTISSPDEKHPCRILIGELTHHYVHHLYNTQQVGEFQLKGKDEFSKIYQVITS